MVPTVKFTARAWSRCYIWFPVFFRNIFIQVLNFMTGPTAFPLRRFTQSLHSEFCLILVCCVLLPNFHVRLLFRNAHIDFDCANTRTKRLSRPRGASFYLKNLVKTWRVSLIWYDFADFFALCGWLAWLAIKPLCVDTCAMSQMLRIAAPDIYAIPFMLSSPFFTALFVHTHKGCLCDIYLTLSVLRWFTLFKVLLTPHPSKFCLRHTLTRGTLLMHGAKKKPRRERLGTAVKQLQTISR